MSIRHIFADNLKNLIGRNGSVSDVSRKLEISRTQLIRYTTGESFPGPDILVKLCDFFDVPLTIIKIPIADIEAAKTTQGLPSGFANCFEPAQKSAFPNGFYSEYTYCNSALGQFQHCIGHAATIQDRRIFSIYAPNRNLIGKNLATQRQPKRKFIGYAFSQSSGFCILDNMPCNPTFALTSFLTGFSQYPNIYPSFKLSSRADISLDIHSGRPTVLEYIGNDYRIALRRARQPQYIQKEGLSEIIKYAFEKIFSQNATPFV
jgi:transcriptional regulator with XRE-family HTH domain